jgi:hypothetical protein
MERLAGKEDPVEARHGAERCRRDGVRAALHAANRAALRALLSLSLLVAAAAGHAGQGREHDVKAAFIFNFAKYVDWPSGSFERAESPFVIGIVGADPFEGALDRTVAGKTVNGHPFTVRRVRWGAEMRSCHILFVCASEKDRVSQLAATLQGAPVFSVGESAGFASHGGVAGFFVEQGRVRFEINPDAAKRARLVVSSRLLALARIVTDSR